MATFQITPSSSIILWAGTALTLLCADSSTWAMQSNTAGTDVLTVDSKNTGAGAAWLRLFADDEIIIGSTGRDPTVDFAGGGAITATGNPTVNLGTGALTLNSQVLTMAPNAVDLAYALQVQTTTITAAQIRALAGTPILIVTAPGAGLGIAVSHVLFELDFNTTAHDDAAADGNLIVEYSGGQNILVQEGDGLIDGSADTQRLTGGGLGSTGTIQNLAAASNASVQLTNNGAEYTSSGGGDSPLIVSVYYFIMTSQL